MPLSLRLASLIHWTFLALAAVGLVADLVGNPARAAGMRQETMISFYHLRLEFETTSDWSTLLVLDSSPVLTVRTVDTQGDPSSMGVTAGALGIGQSLEEAEVGARIGMTVDFALEPAAGARPVMFLLRKGALNSSQVRVFVMTGSGPQLLAEVQHDTVVEADSGHNPLPFQVDLAAAPLRTVSLARPEREKMLWAFYYVWYGLEAWDRPVLQDTPTMPYASDDPAAMARHIEQAQSAGIDGFIVSWWGPGEYSDRNLATLLDIARERAFRITVYFETQTPEGPRPESEIFTWLEYLLHTYGQHPAYMQLDGLPLLVVYQSALVPLATWASIFDRLREAGLDARYLGMGYDVSVLEAFDGLHEYGLIGRADLAGAMGDAGRAVHYYGLLSDSGASALWAATVQPGYDDRLFPGREGLLQPRRDGAFYRATFEAALQSMPDWICITSWNEWWEHTYIEPSARYGEQYLDITREYAARWRDG